jgi:hypothetical protein
VHSSRAACFGPSRKTRHRSMRRASQSRLTQGSRHCWRGSRLPRRPQVWFDRVDVRADASGRSCRQHRLVLRSGHERCSSFAPTPGPTRPRAPRGVEDKRADATSGHYSSKNHRSWVQVAGGRRNVTQRSANRTEPGGGPRMYERAPVSRCDWMKMTSRWVALRESGCQEAGNGRRAHAAFIAPSKAEPPRRLEHPIHLSEAMQGDH